MSCKSSFGAKKIRLTKQKEWDGSWPEIYNKIAEKTEDGKKGHIKVSETKSQVGPYRKCCQVQTRAHGHVF
jgi:hypothetical protein